MDIVQLYQDFSVDFVTEGHKHCRPGWVNVECPWCEGNPGYHLSYNLQNDYYLCWRCGWHQTVPTIARLIKLPVREAGSLVKKYGLLISKIIQPRELTQKKEHRLPSNVHPLTAQYFDYLKTRNFDKDRISKIWTLAGTGPVSRLDGIDFKFRLIIPIIWNGQEVSFTARDITGKSPLRYITCPKDREVIEHKHILYGKQEEWGDTGICVEGPADVWRMGVNAFATFGIKYTIQQVREMVKAFKRIFVMFDDDPQAQIQAKKLVAELKFRGVDAWHIEIQTYHDPGEMKQEHADHLVNTLLHMHDK